MNSISRRFKDRKTKSMCDVAAKKAAYELRDKIQDKIERDIFEQTIATVFWVLHKNFGFGSERLKRLKDATEDEFVLMQQGILGNEYNPRYCQEWLKSIGIDLTKSQYK